LKYNPYNVIKKPILILFTIIIIFTLIMQNSIGQNIEKKIINENKINNNINITKYFQETKLQENYSYVIITDESLEDSTIFFKNWKELLGYSVKIVNTSWIYSNYNGSDEQVKIRNFLIDKYLVWGIEYLLIIGSNDLIPMRNCYNVFTGDNNLSTDYYYADLNSNWDSDGDGLYAEYNEDENPDFIAEILVGRIPLDEPNKVKQFCQKTINYEKDQGDWKKKTLLIGAITNFENEVGLGQDKTDCASLMEMLWDDIYQPNGFSRITMYEQNGLEPSDFNSDYPLTRDNLLTYISEGYGIINWGSHGLSNSSIRKWWENDYNINFVPDINEIEREYYITSSDSFILNDEKPSVIFSCSCSNSDPNDPNNLGTSLIENGAVIFIGATEYSYYNYGWDHKNDGGSMTIDYYFFDNYINQQKTCGKAFYDTLFNCWNDRDIPSIYENMLVFNLFGDPSISLDTYPGISIPDNPIKPSGQESIMQNINYSYSSYSQDQENNQIYYLWDWGDRIQEIYGPYESEDIIEIEHKWNKPGDYRIKVKAINIIGGESSWSEPLIVHVKGPILKIEEINGGLFNIYSDIINTGDAEANNIEWKISIYGGSILLGRYSSGTISNIQPGEKTTINSGIILGIGLPSIIIIEINISDYNSDIEIISADILLFIIKIN